MAYTDQRLFRAQALEPIAALGDVLFMLDQKGPLVKGASAFYGVAGIEPYFGPAPHSMLVIWNQAGLAAAPAGYGTQVGNTAVIPEGGVGTIVASGSVKIPNPKILQQGPGQLLQCRFALKPLALTGVKEHDIEMQVAMPAAMGKFGILGGGGYLNMADQFQDPADVIDSPAQGVNQTLPAVFPSANARDQANLTEMFIWEINGPTFTLFNNGGASLSGGTIGLRIWGFRYDLVPLHPTVHWKERWVYNGIQKAPPVDRSIVVVQTATFTGPGSY